MKSIFTAAFVSAAALALAGCGSSQNADEAATADSVEMPAEEAMTDTTGMPSDMPSGMASDMAGPSGMATDSSMKSGGMMSGTAPSATPGPDKSM